MNDLLVLIALSSMAPFAFFGVYKLTMIILNLIKIRRGHIKVYQITKSGRLTQQLSIPKGEKIELGRGKNKKTLPYNNKPGFLVFQGSTPIILYDDKGIQFDFKGKANAPVDMAFFDNLVLESYNLGILVAQREQNKQTTIMYILLLCSAASAVLSYLTWQGMG